MYNSLCTKTNCYDSVIPFDTPDIYVPFFYFIEFMCMFGWLKVAETMLNPFGEDDADFDCNYLIDRNLTVSYLIVDEAEDDLEMKPDPFLISESGLPEPRSPVAVAGKTPVTEHEDEFTA